MSNKTVEKEERAITSRKMWFAIGTSIAIVILGLLSARYETIIVSYPEMVGGLLGSLGLYMTGNVTSKWARGVTDRTRTRHSRTETYRDGPPIEGAQE